MTKHIITDSRALVTGASSGIGRAVVVELAREGVMVLAVARREERLQSLVQETAALPGKVLTLAGDVTDPAVRQRAMELVQAEYGGLDLLLNNAGVGAMGRFEDADPQRLRRIMEVNFFALAEMIRLALPLLKQGRRPMIVNVSSILGRRGVPYNSEYCASKFAVTGFSESLRTELVLHGIEVLLVDPGTTETEFFDRVLEQTEKPKWPEHRPVSAEAVARAILRGIRRGRHEIVPYRWGKVLLWLNRLAPRWVDRLMERYA
ncbi:MAG: SDR family NAD(P)-dependent oxidoreductase [Pirellulales bacterium]|nr:SDR family NAD(P)-dependent oxidoreductase [Pirellulales bacterium]